MNAQIDLLAMNRVGKQILDDLAAPLPGLVHAYGAGCKGNGSATPALGVAGVPAPGKPLTLELRAAPPKAGGLLLVGDSRTAWGTLPLPFDLAPLGAVSCAIFASADVLVALSTDATGSADLPVTVPRSPSLAGERFFVQALVRDASANAFGAVVSNGLELRVGN